MTSNSLERINPLAISAEEEALQETLALHMERYHYAGQHLVPGSVADIACGVGYGSHLLATGYGASISQLLAVDIDHSSIAFAKRHYAHAKISYLAADAADFQSNVALNNIVSLETIEHLPQPLEFVQSLFRQLAPGGRFIASVPVTPSMDANKYHLSDFTKTTFTKMFTETGLRKVHSFIQVQRYNPLSLLGKKGSRTNDLRKNIPGFYCKHPSKFFLRLQSLLTDGFTNKYYVAVFEKSL